MQWPQNSGLPAFIPLRMGHQITIKGFDYLSYRFAALYFRTVPLLFGRLCFFFFSSLYFGCEADGIWVLPKQTLVILFTPKICWNSLSLWVQLQKFGAKFFSFIEKGKEKRILQCCECVIQMKRQWSSGVNVPYAMWRNGFLWPMEM